MMMKAIPRCVIVPLVIMILLTSLHPGGDESTYHLLFPMSSLSFEICYVFFLSSPISTESRYEDKLPMQQSFNESLDVP